MDSLRFYIILILLSASPLSVAQQPTPVLSTHYLNAAVANSATSNKPIAIFIYTEWCRFCHAMKVKTFNNPQVIKLLNTDFLYVPFDAQSRETVTLNGKSFTFKPSGNNQGIHEIAIQLMKNQRPPTYPTFIILNKDLQIILEQSGYIDTKTMIKLLTNLTQY